MFTAKLQSTGEHKNNYHKHGLQHSGSVGSTEPLKFWTLVPEDPNFRLTNFGTPKF